MNKHELRQIIREEVDKIVNRSIINEYWHTRDKYSDSYMHDVEDLEDEKTVTSFIEYMGLPKLVLDIWKYSKSNLNAYPTRITNRGMEYSGPGHTKIELEFTPDGKVNLYQFMIKIGKESKIDYKIMNASSFNYKIFKDMMT